MTGYLIRRLILLPFTLFAIILMNFVILNLTPGDPVTQLEKAATGDASRSVDTLGLSGENAYLQFREHYGLTLPVLFNLWPTISRKQVTQALHQLVSRKKNPSDKQEMTVHAYHARRVLWGDRARFILPHLLAEASDTQNPFEIRKMAANLFIRGATRQGHVSPILTSLQKKENQEIAARNYWLSQQKVQASDTEEEAANKISRLKSWLESQPETGSGTLSQLGIFFFETRFFRYLSRVATLDFGTLRNDANRSVISEVSKRIKYSLTLAFIPMMLTFVLCQIFGMVMATQHGRWPDAVLNIFFLILFAIPVFVVAPFFIEKVALHRTIPFTQIPIPFSGFHSPEDLYSALTSPERLADIALHICLPLVAIMYGTLAVQSRLSRTAFLEVLRQDYVRTARAKGLPASTILIKHVGRNGAITIVTSLAASLGVVLGGSLIVETIFEINGFGRFFYEAILNRDFNVVLFSALAGSFLSLVGYLAADIAYTLLDPRVSLD